MKHTTKLMFLIPAALFLAACQQQKEQQRGPISVEPASMTACDPAAEVTVKWDFRHIPGLTDVAVYVGSAPNEKLFVKGGASGSAKTGPWTRPGARFVAKENATGKVLGEATVQGPKCP